MTGRDSEERYDSGEVLAALYAELRRQARILRARHVPFETLNSTAIVHEAYLKLSSRENLNLQSQEHFFRIAARAMRDVLVDYARYKQAEKRGGRAADTPLAEIGELPDIKDGEILAVHDALARLEAFDERIARVVELRYFVGLTIPETARVLGISPATVRRDWATGRAWLQRDMENGR